MFSASLTPQITIPTRLTACSRNLIDKTLISDHLAQFLIFLNQSVLKENNNAKYKRSYKNLDNSKFKNELQSIDWTTSLSINNNDVNQSLENFLNISNSLLDKYAPLKQITKK